MFGNRIIVSSEPRGRLYSGPVTGTPRPGVIMQIDISEGINADGNFTWEVFTQSDGVRPAGPFGILLPQKERGVAVTVSTSLFAAYTSGDECEVYVPVAGEQFNLEFQNQSGTADDVAFGDVFIIDSGTGQLLATTGSPETEPFMSLEAYTDPAADKLIHVIYTGY